MDQTRTLVERGQLKVTTILVIDALSVFQAVSASVIKEPTEKGLAVHVLWLREKLDQRQLHLLRWTDTRDMNADGHIKGSVARDSILMLMDGKQKNMHVYRDFAPRIR